MAQRTEEERVEIKPLMEGSFPCRIPYSLTRDLYINKLSYFLVLGLPLLATIGIFFCAPWVAVLPFGVFLLFALLSLVTLISSRRRFAKGTILPGIVFDAEQNLIAVLADLGNGTTLPYQEEPRPWHCVKIFQGQVDAVLGSEHRVGARVPVVATFKPLGSKWVHSVDFDPALLGEGTWHQEVTKAAMDAISNESWAALERAVRTVPAAAGVDQLFLVKAEVPPYQLAEATMPTIAPYVLGLLKHSHVFVVNQEEPSPANGPARQIARYVLVASGFDPNHDQATIASWRHREGTGGLTITTAGFGQAGAQPSFFASWANLEDAMFREQVFELLMKDGTRYCIENSKFPGAGLVALEPMIDCMRDEHIVLKLLLTPYE